MRKEPFIKKLMFLAPLILGILMSHVSSLFPLSIERIYSNGLYRIVGQLISNITGIIPISIGEFLVVLVPFTVVILVMILIARIIKTPNRSIYFLLSFGSKAIFIFGVVYLSFNFLWGLNYYRLPFGVISGLNTKPASVNELALLCESLIERSNNLRSSIFEDDNNVMYISNRNKEILTNADEGYRKAALLYPELKGRYGTPKIVLLSKAMSYTGISGVYFPFTGEANINGEIPDSMFPSTVCHEMAHQRGFAREDEANYIAYLTCNLNSNIEFQYSGTLLALIHSMNSLYVHDREKYTELREQYSEGLLRDLIAINSFWKKYEGPVEKTHEKINDAYLKANRQKEGVKSYGRMIDLLIAEQRASKEPWK